jgi:hypothetical protein
MALLKMVNKRSAMDMAINAIVILKKRARKRGAHELGESEK